MTASKKLPATGRIDYIDLFKSFGILAMVMGHIGFGETLDFFIHAFHMPMFFWISGFLFTQKPRQELSLGSFLKKKARTLLLPYFVFGIGHFLLYVVIKLVVHDNIDTSLLLHLFWNNTNGLAISGALWFLTALFLTELLFFLLDRSFFKGIYKAVVIVAIAIFGNLSGAILPFTLPFALSSACTGVGLFYIGYLCKKYADQKAVHLLLHLPFGLNLLLGIGTVGLIFLNGYINMRTGNYAIIPLFWVNAILFCFAGLNFARFLSLRLAKSPVKKWLSGIGQDSIVYVCLNQLVIMFAAEVAQRLPLPNLARAFVTLILTLFALWVACKLLMNTKLRLLLGKK